MRRRSASACRGHTRVSSRCWTRYGPTLLDIITPPKTHRAFVAAAIERRIPVICQKPFGENYADALAIIELAERANVPLVIHENFRWAPWYREAKRLIEAGQLGTLHAVAFRLRPGDGQGPRAYLDRQPYFQGMPRFLVMETAIHWIDTFRFLMGEVVAVSARLRRINPVIAGEDAGSIVFEFEGGATGLFDGNRLNDHVAKNPAPHDGRSLDRRFERRVAPGRRRAPVVEAAPGCRERTPL